jgi:putative ABC transport system permease protein
VQTENVTTAPVNLAFTQRRSDAEIVSTIDRMISELHALPGVISVGVGTSLPPNANRMQITLRRTATEARGYVATAVPSTPGYFPTLGIRLRQGRLFRNDDDSAHQPVVIMSAGTARRFFGAQNAIGRTLALPASSNGRMHAEEMRIVGVVDDVRYSGLAAAPDDQLYRPFAQQPWPDAFVVIRTAEALTDFGTTVRRAIASVDSTIAVGQVDTLDHIVSDIASPERFRTVVLGAFAALALAIAAVGLYGVMAHSVSQRAAEIGLRMAIGASTTDIGKMVITDALKLGFAGIAMGIGVGYVFARVVSSVLYGITPADPISFAAAAVLLLLISLASSIAPAMRAARIDPIEALKAE